MKKTFKAFLFIGIIVLLFTSCSSKQRAQKLLEINVRSFQNELPIDLGNFGKVSAIDFKDGVLTFSISASDMYLSIMQTLDQKILKDGLINGLSKNWEKSGLLKNLIGAKASVVFNIKDATDKTKVSIHIPSEDIVEIDEKMKKGENVSNQLEIIKAQTASMKSKCPIQLQQGLYFVDADVSGSTVSYTYKIDTDVKYVEQYVVDELKQKIVISLKNTYGSIITDLIAENIKFVYVYLNSNGDKLYQIDINSRELQ